MRHAPQAETMGGSGRAGCLDEHVGRAVEENRLRRKARACDVVFGPRACPGGIDGIRVPSVQATGFNLVALEHPGRSEGCGARSAARFSCGSVPVETMTESGHLCIRQSFSRPRAGQSPVVISENNHGRFGGFPLFLQYFAKIFELHQLNSCCPLWASNQAYFPAGFAQRGSGTAGLQMAPGF